MNNILDAGLDTAEVRSFKLKRGYCHILPDRIIIDNNEEFDQTKQSKNFSSWGWLFNILFSVLFAYFAYADYLKGNTNSAMLKGFAAIMSVIVAISYFRHLMQSVILKSAVTTITFTKGNAILGGHKLVVHQINESGKPRVRWLLLLVKNTTVEEEAKLRLDNFSHIGYPVNGYSDL